MASPDDLPALEPDPRLFKLTSLAGLAAAAPSAKTTGRGRGGAAGAKRKRGATDEAEEDAEDSDASDFSQSSDDDSDAENDDDGGLADEVMAAAASAAASGDAGLAFPGTAGVLPSPTGRALKAKRELDVDGVARPMFPVVQSVAQQRQWRSAHQSHTISVNHMHHPADCRLLAGVLSGKYVCLGGKSTVDAVTIARRVARKVQRIPEYHDVGFHKFSLNNLSANGAFGYRINLRALADDPSFMDYTEYDPEYWKGLHYRLPVDPTKTMADLLPSYAAAAAARARAKGGEQWSTDEFLQQGEHALHSARGLNYYSTTGTGGARAPKTGAGGKAPAPLRLPPSLHGQILTATIYSNGRLTLTGVRREKDIHDAFRRLFHILQPFAMSVPPDAPPLPPPYPRVFLPGQRKLMKREQRAREQLEDAAEEGAGSTGPVDVKPAMLTAAAQAASAPRPALQLPRANQPLVGTFAVKPEPGTTVASNADDAAVKAENGEGHVKSETDAAPLLPHGDTLGSAIVLDGLPEEAVDIAGNDDVEWE